MYIVLFGKTYYERNKQNTERARKHDKKYKIKSYKKITKKLKDKNPEKEKLKEDKIKR